MQRLFTIVTCLAVLGSFGPCGLGAFFPSTSSDVSQEAVATVEPTSETTATPNIVTATELDAIFGDGNWGCFPESTISVFANVAVTITVAFPVSHVDMMGTRYGEAEDVPPEGAATVWLRGEFEPRECPFQLRLPTFGDVCTVEDLSEYGPVEVIDSENGQATVEAEATFVVPSGWTVDAQDVKYVQGEIVPSGPATWWAPGDCKPLQ